MPETADHCYRLNILLYCIIILNCAEVPWWEHESCSNNSTHLVSPLHIYHYVRIIQKPLYSSKCTTDASRLKTPRLIPSLSSSNRTLRAPSIGAQQISSVGPAVSPFFASKKVAPSAFCLHIHRHDLTFSCSFVIQHISSAILWSQFCWANWHSSQLRLLFSSKNAMFKNIYTAISDCLQLSKTHGISQSVTWDALQWCI